MSFPEAFMRKKKEPAKDWWTSGWGPNRDQPNPFLKLVRRAKQDVEETAMDLRDEPSEVPDRIRKRLKSYVTGQD